MFDDLLTGITVSIDGARCLNNRHDSAGCRRCVDVCPTAAIALGNGVPTVDAAACVRCGACAPVCPTDAVTAGDAPERRLADACHSMDSGSVTVACVANPRPRSSAGGPTVRHGRCLASLSAEQLLGLTGDGTRRVELDMSWCEACPIGTAADGAIATVETIEALIPEGRATVSLVGLPGAVDDLIATDSTQAVVESHRPSMSRRGLFSSMRRRVEGAVQRGREIAPPPLRRTRGPVLARLPQSVPGSRRRLLERLRHVPPRGEHTDVPATQVPFADVVISNSCSACGLCARYCPTGALTFATRAASADAPRTFNLSFQMSTCIDCGICATACPEDAVTFAATIDTRRILEPEPTALHTGTLASCTSCTMPTAATDGPGTARCFSCRLGSGVVTALRDDAGLMADLLSRQRSLDG